ncbi:MAG TPA: response regulator [Anaerolineae bacterium]|nr:response regulator [Anaerolineae bacterium]
MTEPSEATVLIVEDDENNQLVLRKLLQLAGIKPDNMAAIDSHVIPYLENNYPHGVDLILLDLQLPGKDGYAILKELRAHAAYKDTTVAAVTANVMRHDIEAVHQAGFDGFIGKPIDARRLPEWIHKLLRGESVWTAQ